jgi:predicted N-acetyltransferase YhbS
MIIRLEEPKDYLAVERLTLAAFNLNSQRLYLGILGL